MTSLLHSGTDCARPVIVAMPVPAGRAMWALDGPPGGPGRGWNRGYGVTTLLSPGTDCARRVIAGVPVLATPINLLAAHPTPPRDAPAPTPLPPRPQPVMQRRRPLERRVALAVGGTGVTA